MQLKDTLSLAVFLSGFILEKKKRKQVMMVYHFSLDGSDDTMGKYEYNNYFVMCCP